MHLKNIFNTIDTHTAGGPTRVVVSGIPSLKGTTVKEKKEYFTKEFDHTRKMLMQEPRGHAGMFGAVLTDACEPDADTGVFFLTSAGYLDMCVHSAIGVAMASWETGITATTRKTIVLDTPAGLIPVERIENRGTVLYKLTTRPAYVCSTGKDAVLPEQGRTSADVVFSGVFFLMIDMDQHGIKVTAENAAGFINSAPAIISEFNGSKSPDCPVKGKKADISMVVFYNKISRNESLNLVVSASGAPDRSPCGAGTGALMTLMHSRGELDINENFTNKSLTGTEMTGYLSDGEKLNEIKTSVPNILSEAYITGFHQFVSDCNDPLHPFLM